MIDRKIHLQFTGFHYCGHLDFLLLAWVGLAPVSLAATIALAPGLAGLFLCAPSATVSSSTSFSARELRLLGPFGFSTAALGTKLAGVFLFFAHPCSVTVATSAVFSVAAGSSCCRGSGWTDTGVFPAGAGGSSGAGWLGGSMAVGAG